MRFFTINNYSAFEIQRQGAKKHRKNGYLITSFNFRSKKRYP